MLFIERNKGEKMISTESCQLEQRALWLMRREGEGRDREGPPATEPWEFAQEIRCRDQPATPG